MPPAERPAVWVVAVALVVVLLASQVNWLSGSQVADLSLQLAEVN